MKRPRMTEEDVLVRLLDEARWAGWRSAHFRAARTEKGWRTPVQGQGKGFPDLVLVHPERGLLAFLEVKGERGRVTPEQAEWMADLEAVAHVDGRVLEAVVWPKDLEHYAALIRDGWDPDNYVLDARTRAR